jgi:hypothetical protein
MVMSAGVRHPYRSSDHQRTRGATLPSASHQPLLAPSRGQIMSQTHSNASSSSNFQSIFNAALGAYEKKTKCKLCTHPLASRLQSCESPTAIISVLQDLIQQFDRRRNGDERLSNWLNPTVNVLYVFSDFIGQGVGLVSLHLAVFL